MKKITPLSKQKTSLVLAFVFIFLAGFASGQYQVLRYPTTHQQSGVRNADTKKPDDVDFSLFWDAWKVVQDNYLRPIDNKERVYGAIAGQIASLGDPFSTYLKPQDNNQFNEDLNGNFDGIGAELTLKDNAVTVVAPLQGSPAEKAGLKASDIIVKINDKDAPQALEDAVKQIRGPKGTQVKLSVVREGKLQDITITRDNVEVKSVTYMKKDNLGVVKMNLFSGNTVSLLDDALEQAEKDKVKGIVLDLRNNPGGLLDVAVDATSRFIEPGVVVVERDKNGKDEELKTTTVKDRTTLPMVMLVNNGSASASEILAGALQDYGRAKIVGETTFGKGSVQALEPLKDGSAVRITIAEWLTPKKRAINKVGIKPDTEVKLTEDDAKAKHDPQMDKAVELLN